MGQHHHQREGGKEQGALLSTEPGVTTEHAALAFHAPAHHLSTSPKEAQIMPDVNRAPHIIKGNV